MAVQAERVFEPLHHTKEAKEILELGREYYNSPYVPYQGPLVARQNEMQRTAQEMGAQTGQWLPFLQQAQRMNAEAIAGYPEQHQRYMNPFEDRAVQAVTRDINRNFVENTLPALENMFLRRGQHGSSKHREMAGHAHTNMQAELLNQLAKMRMHGYEFGARLQDAEQTRRMQLAEQLAGLGRQQQAARIAEIGTLQDLGLQQQQHEQNIAEAAYNQFLRQQSATPEKLQMRAALLHGLPFHVSSSRTFGESPQPRLNTAGKLGSLAMALLGMRRRGMT